jgi:two-component system sensor histidine kinase FlrB
VAASSEQIPGFEARRPPGHASDLATSSLSPILEALPGAAVILDRGGFIRQVNANAVMLLEEPLVGCTWSAVVARAFAGRDAVEQDLLLGTGRWVRLSRRVLPGDGGEILILTDVTASHHLAELGQRRDRLSCIGEMTARLAHQLRTPVTSALLYARQIRDESVPHREPAGQICDRLAEIARMIDETLSFAGGTRGCQERFAVDALFDEIVATSKQHFDSGLLDVVLLRRDLRVAGNRAAIKGALLNLIENAAEACGPSGRIELGAELIRDRICLTVSDNGPGIPAAIRDKLFEPFFTTRPRGTGLGLAVVKSVAEAHNGEIIIDSSARGTTVALCLPRDGGTE